MARRFESEQRKLDQVVRYLRAQEERPLTPSLKADDLAELLIVCTGLVRLAVSHGEGINTLLKYGMVDATAPIQRALYELWVEIKYMLGVGSKVDNARRFMINAALELQELVEERESQYPEDIRQGVMKALDSYKAENPEIFEVVHGQRQRRRHHWSGLSRSKMEQAIAPGSGAYRSLSWEAHAILYPLHYVADPVSQGGVVHLEFKSMQDSRGPIERVSQTARGMLRDIWNSFAEEFGLGLIDM